MIRFLLAALLMLIPSWSWAQQTIWNSWELSSQNPVNVELFESQNTGVIKGTVLSTFTLATHPQTFNNVEQFWTAGTAQFPYVGKSTVGRGMDAGETNAQEPLGVRDLQVHPPNTTHYVIVSFVAPVQGNYTVSNLGVRRVSNMGGNVVLRLYDPQQMVLASLTATPNRAWVMAQQSYIIYNVPAGQSIYFAVDRAGDFGWDATEISWTVTLEAVAPPPPPPPPPPTPSCATTEPLIVINPVWLSFVVSPDHDRISGYRVAVFAEGVAVSESTALTQKVVDKSLLRQGLEPNCVYVTFSDLLLAMPAAIPHRTAVQSIINGGVGEWSPLSVNQVERLLPAGPSGVQAVP